MQQRVLVMPASTTTKDTALRHVVALTGALFPSYLTVAMALPAIPVHVQQLGLDNVYGGVAVGIAFLSTILTRGKAGAYADRRGGKVAMQHGLLVYAAAGLICLASSWTALPASASFTVLVGGRLLLGLGESVAMVGMIGWALGVMGQAHSGRVMALVGIGMYGAFAAGGPLGLLFLDRAGFPGLMIACTVLPLVGLASIARLPAVTPQVGKRDPFWKIVGQIWRSGAAVGLQGVGFAGLGAFSSLYFLISSGRMPGLA